MEEGNLITRENADEKRVKQWLASQGHSCILDLSRDRNDPPDLFVDNCIAVEVTRLDWKNEAGTNTETIENALGRIVKETLEKAGEPPERYKVYVWCDLLGHVLPPPHETKRQVKQAVNAYAEFLCEVDAQSREKRLQGSTQLESGKLSFRFCRSATKRTGEFELVQASFGKAKLVVKSSISNINRCIHKKTKAVRKKGFHCFPVWWLVLVDWEFSTPLKWEPNEQERDEWQQIRNSLVYTEPWSRIVVIGGNKGWCDFLVPVELIENATN